MSNNEPERFASHAHLASAPVRIDIERSVAAVRSALEALRFGSVTLIIHDSRVVQLDVTEKTRFST
ncbi:MAG: YezD family protein [Sphingobium sp.]|uniref:YezD family protein n=1 Tax=Sphingobium sp. TaxID=1912891 RepID=UPI0029B89D71|nr:YezD family protein [Sphingobium sp.]MDX3910091.1 YezD family protein [Sphingobium sp.]